MEKNTLNKLQNKKGRYLLRAELVLLMMIMAAIPVCADVSNIGANLGNWGITQLGWIALVVIAFAIVGFLVKKAWIPCVIFVLVGGILLYIINNPDELGGIGSVLFRIATQ